MARDTAFADSMQMLYTLELKNKLYECLTSPLKGVNADGADKYYKELLEADPDGKILDAPLKTLYRERKRGKHGIRPVAEADKPLRAVNSEKCSRIILICASVVAIAAIVVLLSFKTNFFGIRAEVTPPMRTVDEDSVDDRDWSRYLDSVKMACDDLDMQIKFPKWIPPEMICCGVSEFAGDNIYLIQTDFMNLEEHYKDEKPLRNVMVLVYRNFDRYSGANRMPAGTHYKIEKINGIEYYVMAESDCRGYVVIAVDGEFTYRLDIMCDYQTLLKILNSIELL